MLARQIENGAPFDVFLSANQQYVKELADAGVILPDSVRDYAKGRLGLWSTGRRLRFEDLGKIAITHLAIPNPAHAPYGVAARQALERRGLWNALQSKVVYGENVRQTLQFAESGNADACITAWSLVLNQGGILLPENWHDPIRQTGGVVARSRKLPLARKFLDLLATPEGRKLLEKFGLTPASSP